ncbi:protein MAINTENANCE OF MERISTEMS-like [Gossypium hirsutum]|uniref:Protein MAINTENANCE OF MERISTEMS-like n=1 Tax=Gossypium hirsutum TaxID=3635 RepID=A0A1U8KPI8_GOSHI|nr:protein MAINTENANCE OF MERISTEMS-like [Gossypium hirsutum]
MPNTKLRVSWFRLETLIRTFDLRYDLISALVQRWRSETHTFDFPCRECTVTLEDVALQLGLPIDGNDVTGVSSISRPATPYYELLRPSPSEGKFTNLRFSWLKANFEYFPSTANEREVMQAVRAYIMHLIGGVLMPDANGNTVHLMYLPLLSNLHNTRSYSWGSVVLAMLYRELFRMTDPSAMDIGECLILLWSTNSSIERSYTIPIYRLMIDNHAREGVVVVSWQSSTPVIRLHTVYPDIASTIGGDP